MLQNDFIWSHFNLNSGSDSWTLFNENYRNLTDFLRLINEHLSADQLHSEPLVPFQPELSRRSIESNGGGEKYFH